MKCGNCVFHEDDDQCKINYGVCYSEDPGCSLYKEIEVDPCSYDSGKISCSGCGNYFKEEGLFEIPGDKGKLCDFCKEGSYCRICLDMPCGFCKDVQKDEEAK